MLCDVVVCLEGVKNSEGPPHPGAVKKFNGRDALLRVRDAKPNTDAEHRVPTGSRLYAQPNFFTDPLGEAPAILPA